MSNQQAITPATHNVKECLGLGKRQIGIYLILNKQKQNKTKPRAVS